MSFQSGIRSGPEAYLTEDHQMPERLFSVIVRGRYSGAPEEGEEKFLFGSCEKGPEGLGGFEAKRLFADDVQFPDGTFFDLGRRSPEDLAGFELLSRVAESGAETDEAIAERADSAVLLGRGQQGMFLADLLGIGNEMGEADLPVHSDPVIGCIAVAHQGSGRSSDLSLFEIRRA